MKKMKRVFSFGNRKLPKSIAIFNMSSAKDCPSRKLGICEHCNICYARKAERMYPQVLPYRNRQAKFWNNSDAWDVFAQFLEEKGTKEINYVRFSEAGDFADQSDVNKMTKLAMILKSIGIKTYGYTARKDLNFKRLMKYACVNGSGFMLSNNFTVVDKPSGKHNVCIGDCKACNLCKTANKLVIEVVKH